MSRHPRNNLVVFQTGGTIIDCSTISSATLIPASEAKTLFDSDTPVVVVGFAFCDRVFVLNVEDEEQGHVLVSKLKRGMISAKTGDFSLLDFIDDEESEDGPNV